MLILATQPVLAEEPCAVNDRSHDNFLAMYGVVDDLVAVDQLASRGVMRADDTELRRLRQQIDLREDALREPLGCLK
jgi:hypothetical protein